MGATGKIVALAMIGCVRTTEQGRIFLADMGAERDEIGLKNWRMVLRVNISGIFDFSREQCQDNGDWKVRGGSTERQGDFIDMEV